MADEVSRSRSGRTGARLRALIRDMGTGVCWICGEAIDKGLPQEHPRAWTMDHIQPVSLRPDLAMDVGNIREAHRDCNGKRGANVNYTMGTGSSRNW